MAKKSYQQKKSEARDLAIDWQYWQAEQSLSYGELATYQAKFESLGRRYGLIREFRENAII